MPFAVFLADVMAGLAAITGFVASVMMFSVVVAGIVWLAG